MTATPVFPQTLKNAVQSFANADGTTAKTVATGAANGSKIESLIVESTDTAARDIQVIINISSTAYQLTQISIPAGSGSNNSTPCVDVLKHAQFPGLASDALGNKYIYLANGNTLQIAMATTVTAGKQINVFAQGGDF
jgi:hypothetical protein